MNSSGKKSLLDRVFWHIQDIKNIYELPIHKLNWKHWEFDFCGHSVNSNLKIQNVNIHLFKQFSYKKVFPTMVSCKVFTFSKSEATSRNNDWEMWYYKIPEMKKEGLWDGSGWAVDVPRMGTVLIIKNRFTVMMGWRGPVLVFRNQITAEHTVLNLQSSADLSTEGVSWEQTSGSPRVYECFHSHSQDMQLPPQPMLTLQQGSHL